MADPDRFVTGTRFHIARVRFTLVVTAHSLAGCSGAQSVLDVRGTGARAIADIWWPMLAAGSAVFLLVAAIVVYLVFRRLPSKDATLQPSPATVDTRRAKRWILIGGIALPVAVLVPLFAASVRTLDTLTSGGSTELTVRVIGHQWWWEIRYRDGSAGEVVAANEIRIPAGRRVRLELTTADGIHSLWIPNLQGKTDLVPGRINYSWIEATVHGISRGQCAEYCGVQHALMALPVVVLPETEFHAWLRHERSPARMDTAARGGAALFVSAGCGTCHAVRGTRAGGTRGPDLTHLAGRRTIAAGALTNTTGNLSRWLADPQAIKPGNKMPSVPLTPEQVSALVSYLVTLR